MAYLPLVSNVLLQDYVEVNQLWGEKNQYGLVLLDYCCLLIPHTRLSKTDKAAQC